MKTSEGKGGGKVKIDTTQQQAPTLQISKHG
jgi:hypothetical protein